MIKYNFWSTREKLQILLTDGMLDIVFNISKYVNKWACEWNCKFEFTIFSEWKTNLIQFPSLGELHGIAELTN